MKKKKKKKKTYRTLILQQITCIRFLQLKYAQWKVKMGDYSKENDASLEFFWTFKNTIGLLIFIYLRWPVKAYLE